jgi:response regulator NasT
MRIKTPTGLRVLVADDNAERRGMFKAMLTENGYGIAGSLPFEDLSRDRVDRERPDAVLINVTNADAGALDRIRELQDARPTPIALFSEDGGPDQIRAAVAAGVSAFIVVGLNGNRVRSAIDLAMAQFDEARHVRAELDKAQAALSERKLIERAKGIIMRQRGLSEEDAYQVMRKTAMDRNIRMADLAKTLIDATEILG